MVLTAHDFAAHGADPGAQRGWTLSGFVVLRLWLKPFKMISNWLNQRADFLGLADFLERILSGLIRIRIQLKPFKIISNWLKPKKCQEMSRASSTGCFRGSLGSTRAHWDSFENDSSRMVSKNFKKVFWKWFQTDLEPKKCQEMSRASSTDWFLCSLRSTRPH